MLKDFRDDDSVELMQTFHSVRQKHLVIIASLRNPNIDNILVQPVKVFRDALKVSSVHRYLTKRAKEHLSLGRQGIIALDSLPQDLPHMLVNRYLEIKRTRLL